MLGEHLKPFGEIWELELINVSVLDLFVNFLVLGTESVAISFEEHLILEFFLEGRVLDVRRRGFFKLCPEIFLDGRLMRVLRLEELDKLVDSVFAESFLLITDSEINISSLLFFFTNNSNVVVLFELGVSDLLIESTFSVINTSLVTFKRETIADGLSKLVDFIGNRADLNLSGREPEWPLACSLFAENSQKSF